ncbi:hypothetical protein Nepgr_028508 [Nepenthes gracilis]|uniref:Uncharacterized protein n=1 Tax=Nepenthes gracilis TaxID=150966 RepID=A0AAD3TBU6_NEPGR|nr:hypothetical protein Nepgr_028508 [Nepenthes gracilis]
MKGTSAIVASVLAASTVALSSRSGDQDIALNPLSEPRYSCVDSEKCGDENARTYCVKEKFAPRFDGLRFIETLVTAHR